LPASNLCLLCSTVINSTGTATVTSCACKSGFWWNSIALTCDAITCSEGTIYNPTLKACVCDPVRSILVASTCTSCNSIAQSNGYSLTATSCGCISAYTWVSSTTGGSCTSGNVGATVTCSISTQITLANGSCFTCPSANGGTGVANGTTCTCSSNYIWNATSTGGSCACNLAKSYLSGTICTACPTGTSGDGKGGCICSANNIWQTNSCVSCSNSANVVLLSNGSCFACGTTGTYTATKIINANNNSCTCTSTALSWNFNGFCDCGTSSAMILSGNTYSCFNCVNASAFTNGKASSTSCTCVSSNLQWNATNKACGCGNAINMIVLGSGSSANCFTCVPSIYMIGASADLSACVCVGKLTWNSATRTCGCSNSSLSIIGSGLSTQCISCSSILYGKSIANSINGCACLGSGLIFNSSAGGSCSCPANSIILPSFTCLACPSGSTPITAY
jgi:hypothetical protein